MPMHTFGRLIAGAFALSLVLACGSSDETNGTTSGGGATAGSGGSGGAGGSGGSGGAGGGGGAGGAGGGAPVDPVLVRVKISAFTGSEPGTIDSTSHPSLFELDSRIASVTLSASNPAIELKNDNGAAAFLPAMTPVPAAMVAGHIDLTITPKSDAVDATSITYTTYASAPSNPSSFRLQSSADAFAATLATIHLDVERTETVPLTLEPTSSPLTFRWEAHIDFGDFGGGEAGFRTNDIIVRAAE